jgi:hypothetical protein
MNSIACDIIREEFDKEFDKPKHEPFVYRSKDL